MIKNAQEEDHGYYLCHANNGIGYGLSKVVFLTVHSEYGSICCKTDIICRFERIRERERNVLFNNTLNTFFYLQLYGVRHMVKDHSDSEKGNPLLLLSINSKGSIIWTIPQTG